MSAAPSAVGRAHSTHTPSCTPVSNVCSQSACAGSLTDLAGTQEADSVHMAGLFHHFVTFHRSLQLTVFPKLVLFVHLTKPGSLVSGLRYQN